MGLFADNVATGNGVGGPAADVFEVRGPDGTLGVALWFREEFLEDPALHDAVQAVLTFLQMPMASGVPELEHWDETEAVFVYPSGEVWSLAEIATNLRELDELMPSRAAAELVLKVAQVLVDAVESGDSHGVPGHGALTPWRVMLTQAGDLVLVGYGVLQPEFSKFHADEEYLPAARSLRYAPPERFAREPEDARSDLYALALIVLELLSGEPVYLGKADEVLEQAQDGAALSVLEEIGGELPDALVEAFTPMLAVALADRPGVEEVIDSLVEKVDGLNGDSLAEFMARMAAEPRLADVEVPEDEVADAAAEPTAEPEPEVDEAEIEQAVADAATSLERSTAEVKAAQDAWGAAKERLEHSEIEEVVAICGEILALLEEGDKAVGDVESAAAVTRDSDVVADIFEAADLAVEVWEELDGLAGDVADKVEAAEGVVAEVEAEAAEEAAAKAAEEEAAAKAAEEAAAKAAEEAAAAKAAEEAAAAKAAEEAAAAKAAEEAAAAKAAEEAAAAKAAEEAAAALALVLAALRAEATEVVRVAESARDEVSAAVERAQEAEGGPVEAAQLALADVQAALSGAQEALESLDAAEDEATGEELRDRVQVAGERAQAAVSLAKEAAERAVQEREQRDASEAKAKAEALDAARTQISEAQTRSATRADEVVAQATAFQDAGPPETELVERVEAVQAAAELVAADVQIDEDEPQLAVDQVLLLAMGLDDAVSALQAALEQAASARAGAQQAAEQRAKAMEQGAAIVEGAARSAELLASTEAASDASVVAARAQLEAAWASLLHAVEAIQGSDDVAASLGQAEEAATGVEAETVSLEQAVQDADKAHQERQAALREATSVLGEWAPSMQALMESSLAAIEATQGGASSPQVEAAASALQEARQVLAADLEALPDAEAIEADPEATLLWATAPERAAASAAVADAQLALGQAVEGANAAQAEGLRAARRSATEACTAFERVLKKANAALEDLTGVFGDIDDEALRGEFVELTGALASHGERVGASRAALDGAGEDLVAVQAAAESVRGVAVEAQDGVKAWRDRAADLGERAKAYLEDQRSIGETRSALKEMLGRFGDLLAAATQAQQATVEAIGGRTDEGLAALMATATDHVADVERAQAQAQAAVESAPTTLAEAQAQTAAIAELLKTATDAARAASTLAPDALARVAELDLAEAEALSNIQNARSILVKAA
ncbi:MAG: hypothetical protein AB8H79_06370, partial [Myxococcota bacterium]